MSARAPAPVVVLGAAGLLGRHLVAALGPRARGLDRRAVDITDPAALDAALAGAAVVVNCAAWTDVDGNERDPDRALAVNGYAVAHVARATQAHGARLVHVSTDFVFDGASSRPYLPDDAPCPLSAYGRAKHAGELAALAAPRAQVVRVTALYGVGGRSFSSRLPELLRAGAPLRLDAVRRVQPTWARTAAHALVRAIDEPALAARRVLHVAARGETTWAQFALALAQRLGVTAPPGAWRAVDTTEVALAAPRPTMALFADTPELALPTWEADLDAFVAARGAP